MVVLALRTDNPDAEVSLLSDQKELGYEKWIAHRELGVTLHEKIRGLLADNGLSWQDIEGVVVYAGPGSFTGLRIGLCVGNALAQGLRVPIVSTNDSGWRATGVEMLLLGENHTPARPFYGAPVHITAPKK